MPAELGENGFEALILAGGASRRMGRDKAFLDDQGTTWLARSLEVVRQAGAHRVWISGRAGVDYSALDAPVLLDARPGRGPLGGMERGLEVAQQPLLLVMAVDLWCMRSSLLRRMHQATEATVGVVPRVSRGWEPLVAWYPRRCLARVQSALNEGRLSVTALALEGLADGWLRAWDVPSEDEAAFANANEPSDLPFGFPGAG